MSTVASRRAALAARLDAWLARGGRRAYNTPKEMPAPLMVRADAPRSVTPLGPGARPFVDQRDWVELELQRVMLGNRVLVPEHLLMGGDRAWRRETVP